MIHITFKTCLMIQHGSFALMLDVDSTTSSKSFWQTGVRGKLVLIWSCPSVHGAAKMENV